MSQVTVQPNQNILDIAVSEYGSLEAAMELCAANGLTLSMVPAAGSMLNAPAVPEAMTDADTLLYMRSRGIQIGTAGITIPPPAPPTMMLRKVLVPDMQTTVDVYYPHIEGTPIMRVNMVGTENFYNLYDLQENWPELTAYYVRAQRYSLFSVPDPGGITLPMPEYIIGFMEDKNLIYPIHDPAGPAEESYIIYSAPDAYMGSTGHVARLIDVHGNNTVCAPMILVHYVGFDMLAPFNSYVIMGKIDVDPSTWIWDEEAGVMRGGVIYIPPIELPPGILDIQFPLTVLRYRKQSEMTYTFLFGTWELALEPNEVYEIIIDTGFRPSGILDVSWRSAQYSIAVEVVPV
ncbi:hypothetical protein GCM10023093_17080 [Nemorincola caseinilytica]|uniref:PASTA domain-containing protein n=1 Tax=Nemorincola caseinilytica TaxID=2054315 RepID=A0ABP8NG46_9BACT